MRVCILLTFIAGCLTLALAQPKPSFCRNYECPRYTTKNSTDLYDIRRYGATNWLTTSVVTTTPWPTKEQKRNMFFKLFGYFTGRNSNFRRLSMAVPGLFRVQKNGENDYEVTMMFYVKDANPPSTRVRGTTMVTRPAMDVYVREFSQVKWPSNEEFDAVVDELKTGIAETSSFDGNIYYRASYNYPFDMKKKQHEVWFDKI